MKAGTGSVGMVLAISCLATTTRSQDPASAALYTQADAAYPSPSVDRLLPVLLPEARLMAETQKACIPDGLIVVTALPAGADQIVMRSVVARRARNGWIVTAKPTGCHNAPVIDFIVLERRFATLDAAVFAVGETLAWPSLTTDTKFSASIFAAVHLPSACSSAPPARVDGKVTDKMNAGTRAWGVAFSGHWREEWTFARCGRTAVVPIEFVADGNGGATFQIADRAIRPGPPLTPQ